MATPESGRPHGPERSDDGGEQAVRNQVSESSVGMVVQTGVVHGDVHIHPAPASVVDSRGVAVSDGNQIYRCFFDDRYSPLAEKLISFTDLIEEKTTGFVGRRFALDAVDRFVATHRSGYFVIEGEPGIGKTALVAQIAKTRSYVHHFVVATLGINGPEQFLENICAQLIARYGLARPSYLPAEASRDGVFLNGLLSEVSRGLAEGDTAVVLIDALDEVSATRDVRQNVLYLPPSLPKGVFFVVTTRPREHEDLALLVDRREFFQFEASSAMNRSDVLELVTRFTERPAMSRRLAELGLTAADLANRLLDKAEGNFMYLHHVLPEIESGRFGGDHLDELPQGLQAYYESHWRRMRGTGGEWLEYRQPVIVHLAAAREPVSARQLARWTGLPTTLVRDALRDWREFVQVENVGSDKRYRIYHLSFQDFLRAKDEVQEIDLRRTHSRIADRLTEEVRRHGF